MAFFYSAIDPLVIRTCQLVVKLGCTINESVNIGYLFGGLNFIVNNSLTSILGIHWI